MKTTLN